MVYGRAQSGDPAAARRTLTGTATALDNPLGVTVDTLNNELVVVNQHARAACHRVAT